jgi:hypothetical protein
MPDGPCMDDQRTDREGGKLVRTYVYCHLAAVLLTAPAQRLDGTGRTYLMYPSLAAFYALPVLLAVLLLILCSPTINGNKKLFAAAIGIAAATAQIVAITPLIQ